MAVLLAIDLEPTVMDRLFQGMVVPLTSFTLSSTGSATAWAPTTRLRRFSSIHLPRWLAQTCKSVPTPSVSGERNHWVRTAPPHDCGSMRCASNRKRWMEKLPLLRWPGVCRQSRRIRHLSDANHCMGVDRRKSHCTITRSRSNAYLIGAA